jgi:DNA polymerase elongation subunit (family B)
MRTLVIDIETRPSMAYVWQTWKTTINKELLIEPSEIICFAAKWLGDVKTQFYSVFTHGKTQMIQAAYELLDTADAIITYNGKSFDIKHLNREFLLAGLTPPSPFKHIDLYLAVRGKFKFQYNSLDYVCQQLGLGKKVKHEGFELWEACMKNDPASWKTMKRYNVGDVKLTEDLYHRLMPWIPQLPNLAAYMNQDDICPGCGSDDVVKRGIIVTTTCGYQRWKCKTCGRWFQSVNRYSHTNVKAVTG